MYLIVLYGLLATYLADVIKVEQAPGVIHGLVLAARALRAEQEGFIFLTEDKILLVRSCDPQAALDIEEARVGTKLNSLDSELSLFLRSILLSRRFRITLNSTFNHIVLRGVL